MTINTNHMHPRAKARRRALPGFSLLELSLVLAIIGILVAMVAVNITGAGSRAKTKTTKAALEVVGAAVKDYHLNHSSYPPSLDVLYTAKFLDSGKSKNDAWDSPFLYEPRGRGEEKFTLLSAGEDKQPGTEDDINYHTMNN